MQTVLYIFKIRHIYLHYSLEPKLSRFTRNINVGDFRLALASICEIDVTSFSEDGRGVNWLCN